MSDPVIYLCSKTLCPSSLVCLPPLQFLDKICLWNLWNSIYRHKWFQNIIYRFDKKFKNWNANHQHCRPPWCNITTLWILLPKIGKSGTCITLVNWNYYFTKIMSIGGEKLQIEAFLQADCNCPMISPIRFFPTFGNPDVLGVQLPEILVSTANGEGFWEF